jgi:SAM-dependent methyltransferase
MGRAYPDAGYSSPVVSTSTPPAAQDAPRFLQGRPGDLREARPWHRLAHVIRALPTALRRLAVQLEVGPGDRLLDYGCAEMPYRAFFHPDAEVVGADLPGNPHATVHLRPDGTVPVADASFDAVLSTQVLEHVEDPALYLSECRRVLRPGGRLLLSTHGIMVWHPDPVDHWRWTCSGLRKQVEEAGLEVVGFEGIMGPAATGLQLVQDAVYWRLPRYVRAAVALVLQSLIALADRLEPRESKDMNALVFAVVARRP